MIGQLAALLVARANGLAFDTQPLVTYWQILDPELLREDLLRSVWLLHSQPPLFNLLLGITLQLSGGATSLVLMTTWWLLACGLTLGTFELLRRLGLGSPAAGTLAFLASVRPAHLLIVNWLTYDLLVAVLVVAIVLVSHDVALGRKRRADLLLWLVAGLCALRSLFHPLIFVATAIWVVRLRTGLPFLRRMAPVALPGALLLLLLLKNLVLFGSIGLSSWFGMSFARVARASFDNAQLAQWHEQGHLAVAQIEPFSRLRDYAGLDLIGDVGPRSPHPALDAEFKSTGSTNYNHRRYLTISRAYLTDAHWLMVHRPRSFLESLAKSWYAYHQPPSRLEHLAAGRETLGSWDRLWQQAVWLRADLGLRYRNAPRPVFVTQLVVIPAVILWTFFQILRAAPSPRRSMLCWMLATIVYVAVVGNTFEVWENQRFRWLTDALFLALASHAISRFLGRWRQRRRVKASRNS